jgi:paraquat-inducible protein A
VLPDLGASAFCAVVVLTLLASQSFDPRLMWDAAGHNSAQRPFDTTTRDSATT